MLWMRLPLDCGCLPVAAQGGPDNRFTVEITRTAPTHRHGPHERGVGHGKMAGTAEI